MNPLKVILASASPRRRQFLAALGIGHCATQADIDETPLPGEKAEALAARLARSKARGVADLLPVHQHPALIIGADTVVALAGELLGKPADAADATRMLVALRGRVHQVHSALAVVRVDGKVQEQRVVVNTTHVTMRAYTDTEIAAYIATGDPLDKAGAYAIQHRGFDPVARLDGCPSGVMGLPAADLRGLLSHFGVAVDCPLAGVCQRLTGLACCQIDSPAGG
ncbi:MAG: septum formation protein Maf [Caldilineaceae bacterium]|nr:septum formation protein Maf [Caldilineaceae bacterium]HRJ44072.1 Maf family protein [Caldilineaceae bacterium]